MRAGARGFTLLEVLATMLLMAIVLPVVMNGITLATGMERVSASRIEAASLAESKLNELAASTQLDSGHQEGDFGEDYPGYRWTADTENTEMTSLVELSVQVLWNARGQDRHVTVTTMKYSGGVQ